jgi:DNA repair protein SbcD/Mre11
MIRFFHTADIHFGVENYGRIDPTTGIHTRLLDFRKSLEWAIDKAIEHNVDFFLFCGDAYKTAYPTPTQQKLLMELLLKLHVARIPAVIIVGNHDHPLSFGKAHSLDIFGNLPVDGFHVIATPTSFRLSTKSGEVQIVGIPWPVRHNIVAKDEHRFKSAQEITQYLSQKVGQLIQYFASQLDPSLPAVLAGHLTVSTGIFSGSEKCAVFGNDPVFLPSQLAIHPFDYVALGHLHRHQNLNPAGHPPIVYSGSIERVDFGERKEDKGVCDVTIALAPERVCSYEFLKTPTRPMIQIEVDLDEHADQTDFLISEIRKYDLTDAIVKVIYHLAAGKKDKVDLSRIQKACTQAHYVVGIIPVHVQEVKERRGLIKPTMGFVELLQNYFDTKQVTADEKQTLIKAALDLYESVKEEELASDDEKAIPRD